MKMIKRLFCKHKHVDPLYTYKENGKENSCMLYTLHPDIARDEFLKENLQKCVDYIRENYDMEVFTKI